MTDLTFAIEAEKRGCPYVRRHSKTEYSFQYQPADESGSFSWIRDQTSPYRKFIIGATLAMWAEMQLLEKREYADLVALEGIRQQAHAFAKGE